MSNIHLFEQLYGKTITDIKAYGKDKFDFARNILSADFSVGQYGYAVLIFGDSRLYISVDGLSYTVPPRKNIKELTVHQSVLDTFIGAVLLSIKFNGEEYSICFDGFELIGRYIPCEGLTDRSYFELEFPWI